MMRLRPFIGGAWYDTDTIRTLHSPFHGAPIGQVAFAGAAGVEAAIRAAEKGFRVTRGLERYQRAELLEKMAAGVRARQPAFTDLICSEGGKPIQLAAVEVKRAAELFSLAARAGLTRQGESFLPGLIEDQRGYYGVSQRFPVGPTVSIDAFNFPLSNLVRKVAPAIAAGVSLIVKPSSRTPATALLLAEVAQEAGLPAGALNVVPVDRETARPLIADDRTKLVFFSGRPESAWAVKAAAVRKRVALEQAGHAAAVIEPDADLDYALPRIAASAFAHAGQTPNSVQRILAHKAIFEEVEQRLLDVTQRRMVSGDPTDRSVVVGPMIDTHAAERVMRWIREAVDAGATVLTGGERKGNVIRPTLLAGTGPGPRVPGRPVQGPVAVLGSYETFSQAIAEVNLPDRGLQAGVFTRDVNLVFRAFQEMDVGTVTVNDFPPLRFDLMPYVGIADSGCGRQGIRWAMDEMTELRFLVLNLV